MVPRKPDPKRPWSQPLGDFVPRILDPAIARQGFGESALLLDWEEIVGERIGAISEPVRLQWPPAGTKRDPLEPRPPAALVLRVKPGFGLEIQHLAAVLQCCCFRLRAPGDFYRTLGVLKISRDLPAANLTEYLPVQDRRFEASP